MVTVYGPRSTAEAMIAGVRRTHDRVAGTTTSGEAYRAPENLMQCTYVVVAVFFAAARNFVSVF